MSDNVFQEFIGDSYIFHNVFQDKRGCLVTSFSKSLSGNHIVPAARLVPPNTKKLTSEARTTKIEI